jgi:HK97 gp10 family phage protein
MARNGSRLEGFREASRQMNEMSKAAARKVGRKSLMVPAEILARAVRQNVPILTGETYESVDVESARQKRGVAVQVVAADIAAVQLEFGNSDQPATPFFRPAVDGTRAARDKAFSDALMIEVDTEVIRKAKRSAKG